MEGKILLTTSEVCRLLGISRSKFYSMPEDQKPPKTVIGNLTRYNRNTLEEWLRDRS